MRILVALCLLASGLLLAPASAPAAPAPADRSAAGSLSRLHATHGKGAAIVNERGARVRLNGVNVNGLGDYFQPNPDFAPTVPLGSEDFEQIAALGFNSVRLIVSWSALEPTRGAYDTAYVDRIRTAIGQAAANGLYVVLDMHQDAWGIAVDTPADETCPGTTQPDNGWDGAPAWATLTDGASTCQPGQRELAPAVEHAWQHFYDNTDGIRTQLVRTWGRLARDVAAEPAVAGFDLLNEPGFGPGFDPETEALGRFYGKAIAAIRSGETEAGGFHHIVFFEPSVLWSALGSASTPAGFTTDRNIAFAPHVYAESLSSNSIADGFASAAKTAASYGVPVWIGEWGYFSQDPQDDADKVQRYGAAQDRYGYGGAWWDWKQACGDPHVIHRPGGQPDAVSPSLIRSSCPDQVPADAPAPAYGEVLSRPLPWAVPGTITHLVSDGRTGAFDLTGHREKGADRCALRIFVPSAWADQPVHTTGVNRLTRQDSHGNVVLRGCVAGAFRVRLG